MSTKKNSIEVSIHVKKIEHRDARICELFSAGHNYEDIGREVGCCAKTVKRVVTEQWMKRTAPKESGQDDRERNSCWKMSYRVTVHREGEKS